MSATLSSTAQTSTLHDCSIYCFDDGCKITHWDSHSFEKNHIWTGPYPTGFEVWVDLSSYTWNKKLIVTNAKYCNKDKYIVTRD